MMKYDNSELCLIWLDSFIGLEYKHKKELYNLINGKDGIKELLVKGEYIFVNPKYIYVMNEILIKII